jgi:hypothetical protein
MKEDSLTSEEKLLRLIRKKDKSSEAPPLALPEDHPAVSPDLPDAANGEPRPGREAQGPEKQMDVLALSIRVLAVTACVILILVLNKYALLRTKPPAAPETSFQAQITEDISSLSGKGEESPVPAIETRSFESYKQTMAGRDVFQAPWEKPVQAASASGASAAELSKQLKLVGILMDKDPKAIVEDLGTQQTFFVSPGERIGNAIVEEIREDKVILIFGQEKVELVP